MFTFKNQFKAFLLPSLVVGGTVFRQLFTALCANDNDQNLVALSPKEFR